MNWNQNCNFQNKSKNSQKKEKISKTLLSNDFSRWRNSAICKIKRSQSSHMTNPNSDSGRFWWGVKCTWYKHLVIAEVLIISDLKRVENLDWNHRRCAKNRYKFGQDWKMINYYWYKKAVIRKRLFVNNINGGMERNRCHIAENVETPIPDIHRKFRTLTGRREWNMGSSGTLITGIHTI
jgi:hypothetical protein